MLGDMVAILSLLFAVYTAEMLEQPIVVSFDVITVVAADQENVTLYTERGNRLRVACVTSGEIVGQPVVSENRYTIVAVEDGCGVILVYETPQSHLISRNRVQPS